MTTTGTSSNYGSNFQFPSGTTYPAQVLDFPTSHMGVVSTTNHAGGGVTEYIPNGLLDISEFNLILLGQHGTMNTLKTAQVAKTVALCVLSDPIDTLLFNGMIMDVGKESADADNPTASRIPVTVRPTGGITISNTP